MGTLTLPVAGQVYLDANAVIYSVEKISPFWELLEPAWQAARDGRIEIVSSELAYLECLVKPSRERDAALVRTYRDLLLDSRDVCLLPIHFDVIERATAVRAETGLKAPDAVHAASALEVGVALFVTNDVIFRRVAGLPVVVLSQV